MVATLTRKMQLQILKQSMKQVQDRVQNDNYQGYIHKGVMLNLFQHLM